MGDAGPQASILGIDRNNDVEALGVGHGEPMREVNVLVTGFGPFKTFATNPSFLIASALPSVLEVPSSALSTSETKGGAAQTSQTPLRPPNSRPYRINIHVYPTAIRVAYASTSTFIPKLVSWRSASPSSNGHLATQDPQLSTLSSHPTNYDYIVHIGLAGGRTIYALETVAHRDHYEVKDVDERDGFISGEFNWKRELLPEILDVGWNKHDVLRRWEALIDQSEERFELAQMEQAGFAAGSHVLDGMEEHCRRISMFGKGQRAVVRLSEDAGRFLCEFILYTSLSTRWKEANAGRSDESLLATEAQQNASAGLNETVTTGCTSSADGEQEEPASERVGKVAFLHVPDGVDEHHIARGVRVAEAAILALVGSWEDGYRNGDIYKEL